MSTLSYILLFTFLGSIGALIGGFILLSKEKSVLKISHLIASFAAGTLLGTAFFDLLPEALDEDEKAGGAIFGWTLGGILLFFLLERFIHWFHHHEDYHDDTDNHESKTTVPLIVISDTAHNFIDGVVIAATFLVSIPLGIVTTLAVAAHEIPQEIGDFGLMLHKGVSRKKIIIVNLVSASAAFFGAILAYSVGDRISAILPEVLAVTAGFFIYIAASDLIPEIHHEKRRGFALYETILLCVGVGVIWILVAALEGSG